MTISAQTNRRSFTGSGTSGPFSYPYALMAKADLVVQKVVNATGVATTLTLDTDYTLAGTADSVGRYPSGVDITTSAVVASGYTLIAYGDPSLTQGLDLVENDPLPVEEIEKALDRLTLIARRLKDRLDRSLVLSDSDTSSATLTLPTPVAGELLGWNSAANALTSYSAADVDLTLVSAFIATLLDDADAAAARTTLGAMQQVLTTRGDLVRGGASGVPERVALGTNGQVLTSNGTDAAWATPSAVPTAATSAEVKTGTNSTKFIAPDALLAGIGFSACYVSAAQSTSAGGTVTLAHGLGRSPVAIFLKHICTSADLSYSVNDAILTAVYADTNNYGISPKVDATNITIRWASGTNQFSANNASSGGVTGMDRTKWTTTIIAFA